MENPTSFDLNDAIRRWRAEFGSPSSLSSVEVEELEAHLRDHVAALQAGGMTPEAAFNVAVKQLGERQCVATEFAKINPQRVWLERAIWMVAGTLFFSMLLSIACVPTNLILNYGTTRQWEPPLCVLVTRLCHTVGLGILVMLCWFFFTRRPDWMRQVAHFCETRPLLAAASMILMVRGSSYLFLHWRFFLERYLPAVDNWIFRRAPFPHPDEAAFNRAWTMAGVVETMLWATAVCLLATHVLRAGRRQYLSPPAWEDRAAAKLVWLRRFLWMVVGSLLITFIQQNIIAVGFITVGRMLPVPARGSLMLEQAHDLGMTLMQLAFWATTIWVLWIVATRQQKLTGWIQRTIQLHPFQAAIGIALLLDLNLVLGQILLWAGVVPTSPGRVYGYIDSVWYQWTSILTNVIAPPILFTWLLRWRMKLREAG